MAGVGQGFKGYGTFDDENITVGQGAVKSKGVSPLDRHYQALGLKPGVGIKEVTTAFESLLEGFLAKRTADQVNCLTGQVKPVDALAKLLSDEECIQLEKYESAYNKIHQTLCSSHGPANPADELLYILVLYQRKAEPFETDYDPEEPQTLDKANWCARNPCKVGITAFLTLWCIIGLAELIKYFSAKAEGGSGYAPSGNFTANATTVFSPALRGTILPEMSSFDYY